MKIDHSYYSEINKLDFYVLGTQENYIDSAVVVTNKELFKGDLPVNNGCYDAGMGSTSYSYHCSTCLLSKAGGNSNSSNKSAIQGCPGHPAVLDISYPVKSPLFRDSILKWLKIVCFKCGRLLIDKHINVASNRVLIEYAKLTKTIDKCPWPDCGAAHPTIYKDKFEQAKFYVEYNSIKGSRREELFNHQIRDILSKISNESVLKMQKPLKSHPKKFMLDSIRVPPNTIRPDIRKVGGSRSNNNDLTALTKNIVEINELLPNEIPSNDEINKELREMYFNLDLTYYEMVKGASATNNQVRLMTTTNKTPSSIASRIPKKTGRIRKSLMGKRTRMMIRSVITGDNSLRVDEIGIPISLARSLQIPETVREFNKEKLNLYYINKRNEYPGCSGINIKKTNKFHRIEHLDPNYVLQDGDIIHRDIIDGDYVGFNRQPSLLFSNVGSHRVVIMETGSTLRINVSACSAYNADFDGDAANALIAQNIQSRTELQMQSWIGNWFISYQNHSPYFGNFQDSLIGSAELTRSDTSADKWHAMQLFSNVTPPTQDNFNFDKVVYTGRELVSLFMPKINFPKKKASAYLPQYAPYIKYDPDEIYVQIKRGQLISGSLDKSTVGQQVMGSIFHIINNEYGANAALETIYNFHQIVARFFLWHGFTVGIRDVNISDGAMDEIRAKTALMKLDAQNITDKLNRGELVPPIGMTLLEFYESEQLMALEPADNFVTPILNDINFKNNKIARLIFTGSKGKKTNLININGGYGQITINGRRPKRNFSWGRTSPYFLRYDTSPESLGFIDTSYREGIRPNVFPFAAGDARHSSISNALSTSVSGAQSRISIKNLESIVINNLRQCAKDQNIVQLLYADSGVDTRKSEKVIFITSMISNTKMESDYQSHTKTFKTSYNNAKEEKILAVELMNEYKQLWQDREEFRSIFFWAEDSNPGSFIFDNSLQMPVNVFRVIEDVKYNYEDIASKLPKSEQKLNPIKTIEKVKEFCKILPYAYYNANCEVNKIKIPDHIQSAITLLQILIRMYMCTANLQREGIYDFHIDIILAKIKIVFKNSLVDYGSTVGIIAAQCLSEPLTQYVLDSKHRSGGGGGTKTSIVDRIKEILGTRDTEKMKNTSMLIMVKPEYEKNKLKVQEIANNIEMMDLERFIISERIFYEDFLKPVHPDFIDDVSMINKFIKHNIGIKHGSVTKWCIRYEINREELIINTMSLDTLITKLRIKYPEMFIVFSPENSDNIIVRCYISQSMIKIPASGFTESIIFDLVKKINTTVIRGVKGITYTEVITVAKSEIVEDGSIMSTQVFGIKTNGSNLEDVLENPYVDRYRTQTDSIKEFEAMYGIEASREKITREIRKTMESENVTREHTSIYSSEICSFGTSTSIQRTGLAVRELNNVSLRLSFQTPIQVIENAATNGLVDKINGISASLICGQTANVGTTYNNVCIDEDFVENYYKNLGSEIDDL
jgi:DNA-directed RNA polymerase II subunit RPB1